MGLRRKHDVNHQREPAEAVGATEATEPANAAEAAEPDATEPAKAAEAAEAVERGPDSPTELPARSWLAVLRRTAGEFRDDELSDRAAALTYYGVLAVFPALLVVVSVLGLIGPSATNSLLDNIQKLAPGSVRDLLRTAVTQVRSSRGAGGTLAVVGLAGALWSASGYVAAFIRASNVVYDMREGRPVWKTTPLRVGLTLLMMALLLASAVIVVFTGPLAQRAGDLLGLGHTALVAWSIAKWPVLVVLVAFMIALLYWAAPNVRDRGFRWVSPGSLLAVVLWLILSAGFALYVANFASYNKTYGTVAGVIVFLVWLWLSNLAILLGLEFDAELARERAIEGGMSARHEPYVPPRDARKWPDEADNQ
ncbi:ribonuclease BN [Catenulispora acidiphila DSM 44928]|uniref:Ribonuclease BN n=1 Tax=Catenulispora acidiphila (strain DSM 44928 / JCM 14897 / NBRC 102108 / NRRL B-24433 / ID139908) TaxID=479433 RepID=C7PZZ1_CATAD|nr:YihY/virulence factor BrkB family protein [Catenulispora acidiphila]ACU75484.1 ribonuclease BN [Catenulispora acidiphila DSM 44928]